MKVGKGTPRIEDVPKLRENSGGSPVTGTPPATSSAMPVAANPVPRVTMNELTLNTAMSTALTMPTANPTPSAAKHPSRMAAPGFPGAAKP